MGNSPDKKNTIRKYLFIFVLIAPVIGFVYTKFMTDKNLKMPPHLVTDRIIQIPGKNGKIKTDTIYKRMRPFEMENQLGDTIGLEDMDGWVTLVNFFKGKDGEVSGPTLSALQKIAHSYARSDTSLRILSISVDPEEDSLPALLDLSFSFEVNHDVWWFLRGDIDSVKAIAEEDFNFPLETDSDGKVVPSSKLILLDRFQHVRGYYDALDQKELKQCVHDLSLLIISKEKLNGKQR